MWNNLEAQYRETLARLHQQQERQAQVDWLKQFSYTKITQLRILPATGCERFAEYLYHTINDFLAVETNGRVKATKIEVYEHERNSACYEE